MQFLLVASLAVLAQSHTLKTVVTKKQPVVKKNQMIAVMKKKIAAKQKMIAVKMIIKKQIILQTAATNNLI